MLRPTKNWESVTSRHSLKEILKDTLQAKGEKSQITCPRFKREKQKEWRTEWSEYLDKPKQTLMLKPLIMPSGVKEKIKILNNNI